MLKRGPTSRPSADLAVAHSDMITIDHLSVRYPSEQDRKRGELSDGKWANLIMYSIVFICIPYIIYIRYIYIHRVFTTIPYTYSTYTGYIYILVYP